MDFKEINEVDKKFLKELNAGISALVLLSVLSRASEPLYGYQIAKQIEESRDEGPIIKLGTLYPVLRSLEDSGLLESEVEPSVTGPPRRYYKITESGRKALENWKEIWRDTREFVDIHVEGGSQ
jgi:PadR family transcriptional regulator, regulatory protein PadR